MGKALENLLLVSVLCRCCITVPVCTAQGCGGSFKDRKPIGGWLVAVNDGSQSEPTDGRTSCWRQRSGVVIVVVIVVAM